MMAVVRERGEALDVLPDFFAATVEQVRAVPVHLNARARIDLAPGVAADMGAAFEHGDAQARPGGAFGDGKAV
jgi:hypothetical protein